MLFIDYYFDNDYHYHINILNELFNKSGLGEETVGNLIVADELGIQLQCLSHGYKKENLVCHSIFLNKGDLLTITNRKKYIVDVGWFILVKINHTNDEFIFVNELEQLIQDEKILDEIGCMLKIIGIDYYLEEALVQRNKEEFLNYSSTKNELTFLYERLCKKIPIES